MYTHPEEAFRFSPGFEDSWAFFILLEGSGICLGWDRAHGHDEVGMTTVQGMNMGNWGQLFGFTCEKEI